MILKKMLLALHLSEYQLVVEHDLIAFCQELDEGVYWCIPQFHMTCLIFSAAYSKTCHGVTMGNIVSEI